VAYDDQNKMFYSFANGSFTPYNLIDSAISSVSNEETIIESSHENLPVFELTN
jgi:hypothetical protein